MGKLSAMQAKEIEDGTLYGSNIMHRFDTKYAYNAKLCELRKTERVIK